ncbi:TolC family protein [Roseococcus sp. SYP-B2431]|uniref:TolC family protein n=1 Tax=Roseococcus sp. SYP-B2431 TaxID=2496640 RepID=UPI00103F841C|nr:TolC family protein [Roseococcus sp. SYP-B2431]TCH98054.1 TolC family protein [Roseococcus sp. SYP-B2431]
MRRLAVLAALCVASPALAQAPPPTARQPREAGAGMQALPLPGQPRVLTLAEAESRLIERNLTVVAAQRGIDAARAQRLVASSLPPMQASIGNTIGEFNETRRNGLQGARLHGPGNNINIGLTVLVELGGKRELRTRFADANIAVAEAQVLDALRIQIFALRQNFIAALAARANLEVALGNRGSLDRTEALLRRQVQDGALPEGDLLRFQASRVPFEADVTTAAQAYAAGVAQVAVALALDAAAPPPPAPPGRDPLRVALPALAIDLRGRFDIAPEIGVARGTLGDAVQSRPDVVVAARQASAAGANTSLAEAQRWRDVTVNGGWGRSELSQDLPNSSQPLIASNQFTLNLSVPLFTRQITRGNIGAAQGQQAQSEALARNALLQARADFATAWSACEQARALLRLYTGGALNRAEQAYRSSEQAYLAGGRSLLDVLDALRTLNATRVAANNARANYLTALAQLEFATGVGGLAPRL